MKEVRRRVVEGKNHHLLSNPHRHIAQHTDLPTNADWLLLPPSFVSHSHNNHMSRRLPLCIVNKLLRAYILTFSAY